jgi:hypothetical protein
MKKRYGSHFGFCVSTENACGLESLFSESQVPITVSMALGVRRIAESNIPQRSLNFPIRNVFGPHKTDK